MSLVVPLALSLSLLSPIAHDSGWLPELGVGVADVSAQELTKRSERPAQLTDVKEHGPVDASLAGRIAGTAPWMPEMQAVANETGVPWELLRSIMVIETGGNANAVDHASGSVGLMTVSPRVATELEPGSTTNLWDPESNIRVVAGYLKAAHARWGSWDLTVAAWADERNPPDASIYLQGYQPETVVTNYLHEYRAVSNELQFAGGGMNLAASALWAGISAIGTPYVYGGQSPEIGFDCSGFTWWAYQQVGITIPRPSGAQWSALQKIDAVQAQPGDIVAFADPAWGSGITHVGLYAGNGLMLHSPREGQVVSFSNIYDSYWGAHLVGFGRVDPAVMQSQ